MVSKIITFFSTLFFFLVHPIKIGSGIFEINGVEHEVSLGTFLLLAPHEKHGIWVPESKDSPLKVVVTGVVVGDIG